MSLRRVRIAEQISHLLQSRLRVVVNIIIVVVVVVVTAVNCLLTLLGLIYTLKFILYYKFIQPLCMVMACLCPSFLITTVMVVTNSSKMFCARTFAFCVMRHS